MNADKWNWVKDISTKNPDLYQSMALVFLKEQLQKLNIETVNCEFDGVMGLLFQIYDQDLQIDNIKMEWFPTKSNSRSKRSWYTNSGDLLSVNICISELPKLDENYSEEKADRAFFASVNITGSSAESILDKSLYEIKIKYGISLVTNMRNL